MSTSCGVVPRSAAEGYPRSIDELSIWPAATVAVWSTTHLGFDDADAACITKNKISGMALLSLVMTVERLQSAGLQVGPAAVLYGAIESLRSAALASNKLSSSESMGGAEECDKLFGVLSLLSFLLRRRRRRRSHFFSKTW